MEDKNVALPGIEPRTSITIHCSKMKVDVPRTQSDDYVEKNRKKIGSDGMDWI
jgi:hypothetical protein